MSDDDGFLQRWSRRKAEAKHGPVVEPPPPAPTPTLPQGGREETPLPPLGEGRDGGLRANPEPEEPPPTLDDVAALPTGADIRRFLAPKVDEDVKRAALKKLFADPRFNVMDGLDTYIDDYNKPDPLPKSMLRQMVQAQFLGLFKDDPQDEDTAVRLQPDDAPGRPDPAPGAGEDPGREH